MLDPEDVDELRAACDEEEVERRRLDWVENGCMSMIRGSHLVGLLDHHDGNGHFVGRCTQVDAITDESVVSVPANAGDITIHYCLMLHSSPPNRSGQPRRGLVFQFRASDAALLGGSRLSDTGRQVRGSFDGRVRCTEAVYRIPSRLKDDGTVYWESYQRMVGDMVQVSR